MNSLLIDSDFCETCFLNDFALDPNDNLVPRVTKKGKFTLSAIPDSSLRATLERMGQTAFTRMRRTNRAVNRFIEENRERLSVSLFHNWVIRFQPKHTSPGSEVIFLRSRLRRSEETRDEYPYHNIFGCGELMDLLEKSTNFVEAKNSSLKEFASTVDGILKYTQSTDQLEELRLDLDVFRRSEFLQREFQGNYRPCYYVVYVSELFGRKLNIEPFIHFIRCTNQKGGFVKFYSYLPNIMNGIVEVLRPPHIYLNLFVRDNNAVKEDHFRFVMQIVRRMTIAEEFALSIEPGVIKYLMVSLEHLNFEYISINRKEFLESLKEGLTIWKMRDSPLKTFIFSCNCHISAFIYYKRLFADLNPVDLDPETCIRLSSQYPQILKWIPELEAVDQSDLFPSKQHFFFEGANGIAVVAVNNEARRFQMSVV